MSTILSSGRISDLGASSVHRWKSIHPWTSPESPQMTKAGAPRLPVPLLSSSTAKNPKSVMVWAWICALGKTPLVFVNEGVKIDHNVYHRDILNAVVIHTAVATLADSNGHFYKIPIQPTERKRHRSGTWPIFLTSSHLRNGRHIRQISTLWIWLILEARGCAKTQKNLEALKQSLQRGWDLLLAEELRRLVLNFRKRLMLCITAVGGQLEVN